MKTLYGKMMMVTLVAALLISGGIVRAADSGTKREPKPVLLVLDQLFGDNEDVGDAHDHWGRGTPGFDQGDLEFAGWFKDCVDLIKNVAKGRWKDAGGNIKDKFKDRVKDDLGWTDYSKGVGARFWAWLCGDPHNVAFNGQKYDFMYMGEFLYAKTGGDASYFEFQARHRMVGQNMTVGCAVAVKLGQDIVIEIYDNKSGVVVNGETFNLLDGLGNVYFVQTAESKVVAMIMRSAPTYVIIDRDLNVVEVDKWSDHLDAYVSTTGKYARSVNGAFGNPYFGLRCADGKRLPKEPSAYQMSQFAQSWAVSADDSLFSDKNHAAFDKDYPTKVVTLDDLDSAVKTALTTKVRTAYGSLSPSDYDIETAIYDVGFLGEGYLQSDTYRTKPEPASLIRIAE